MSDRISLKPWDKMLEILPSLSESELRSLEASIKQDGVQYPILVLPDGRIIDGYHRWLIAGDECPYEVLNISEDEAFILGIALNLARRHLSHEQIREIHEWLRRDKELRKQVAVELRRQGKSLRETAAIVGVSKSSVENWERELLLGVQFWTPSKVEVKVTEVAAIVGVDQSPEHRPESGAGAETGEGGSKTKGGGQIWSSGWERENQRNPSPQFGGRVF